MKVSHSLISITLLCTLCVNIQSYSQAQGVSKIIPIIENDNTLNSLEEIGILDLIPHFQSQQSNHIVIRNNYDLGGKNLKLEEGEILDFRGGSFCNGFITGNKTLIVGTTKAIFNNIKIRGTWNVKYITTDMFVDLNYDQSLQDVLALTDSNIRNHVVIKDYGFYYPIKVNSVDMMDAPLKLKSNTILQLDGRIQLKPTNLFQYVIMLVNECNHVKIHGRGGIIGDRVEHDYSIDDAHKAWKTHEWGHGLKIAKSTDIEISGLEVSDCIGDSYNIGNGSQHIILDGVVANGSRRQGVTIAVASNIMIKNSLFNNIGSINGTNPGAAIDIEPDNTVCEIKNINIVCSEIHNCRQGIISWSKGYGNTWEEIVNGERVERRDGRHYVDIGVKKCTIDGVQYAFSLFGWEKVLVSECKVSNTDFFAGYSDNTTFSDNMIEAKYFMRNGTVVNNSAIKRNKIIIKKESVIRLNKSVYENNFFKNKKVEVVNN